MFEQQCDARFDRQVRSFLRDKLYIDGERRAVVLTLPPAGKVKLLCFYMFAVELAHRSFEVVNPQVVGFAFNLAPHDFGLQPVSPSPRSPNRREFTGLNSFQLENGQC